MAILLVDIDHTLSDAHWRDHMMGDWERYHTASQHDEPIQEVIDIVRCLRSAGWACFGFTARPDRYRDLTTRWLRKHNLQFDQILMRPDDSWRPTVQIKSELLAQLLLELPDGIPIVLLDDHPDVCKVLCQHKNVTALQVLARKQGVKSLHPNELSDSALVDLSSGIKSKLAATFGKENVDKYLAQNPTFSIELLKETYLAVRNQLEISK